MNANKYQKAVMRTANAQTQLPRIFNWALGLCGEAGEVAEIIKKANFHNKELDTDKLKKELGDVLWYLTMVATESGLTLSEIMEANVQKLQARHPQGFRTDYDSKKE